ncbi:MAG: glycosyl hydrolase family 2 [Bacteroides sp.]|nr:glycosyl hydrolase family 2 [Bacteroides sp.]
MNRFRKLVAAVLTGIGCLSAHAGSGSDATAWYPTTVENRPFVRWWWLGSAVDKEGLTFNLEEFAKKGLGGVEITPIYGVKGNEANDIDYLSPKWMEMLAHTMSEGKRLGLQIDMNNGTGWPFGGPDVTTDYSARKCVVEKWTVAPGYKFSEKIVTKDAKQAPVATLQAVIASDGDQRIDLTDKVGKDSVLKWKAPASKNGEWTIYAVFSGRTFQKVKRAAPGGVGLVLNHYDSVAVNHYLDRFDRAFESSGCPIPDTFFNDSYEVYGSDWADNIFDEFYKDHGYRLQQYLPEFVDESNHDDLRSRVVRDYRSTLARLLRENFTEVWMKRAHANGARIRNQSHGSPANIIDLYAAVDIPECESFGQTKFSIPGLNQDGPTRPSDSDPAVLKFASSAAHLTGKRLTSAETLTWLTEHFRTSLSRCKPELDQMFCSGVNHVYFHGAPYSPKGVAFPGWMFYASINMSPTNSIWQDADSLFGYVKRCQAFLSAGTPDNDFLLYFPIEEIWQRQGGNPYLMFDIHKMEQRMPDVKKAVNEIINAGYDADYVSDELLDHLTVNARGALTAEGGAEYKAVIVPPARFMQPATLERMLALAREGATVAFIGTLPSDVPGLSQLDSRRSKLTALTSTLPAMGTAATVTPYGKGRVVTSPDFADALRLTNAKSEPMRTDNGLSLIRRRNEVGGYNYFVTLLQDRPLDGWVTLAVPAESVEIFDPVMARKGMAQTRRNDAGDTQVRMQLAPGESLLLKTFPDTAEGEPWAYVEPAGEPIVVDSGWSISFPKSEPAIEGVFATDTLTQWCKLPVADAAVNFGTGRYTVNVTVDDPSAADDWILDLGDVRESADVRVNGVPAGKVWSVPFRLRVGSLLKPGVNTLEIDVTSLQANRIADYERRGVNWRIFKDANIASVTNAKEFSFGDWPTIPSGLNSQVTLTPVKFVF